MADSKEFGSADEILDFAIERELESHDFYNGLADKMEKPWMEKVFRQFAKEELGHKSRLEGVKAGKRLLASERKIMDLKMADYLVAGEASPDMGYQEALIIAMKKEKAAFKLYHDLAAKVDDDSIKDLFLGLAQEEAKHKLRFEIEYDEVILKEN